MRISYFGLFFCIIAELNKDSKTGTTQLDKDLAQRILDDFVETNVVPSWLEDYLLDIMAGRRVLTSQTDKLLNYRELMKGACYGQTPFVEK